MKITMLLILTLCSGCFFGRFDYEYKDDFTQDEVRVSATVWTWCKDYSFEDPNSWFINSESNTWSIWTPWGTGGTK